MTASPDQITQDVFRPLVGEEITLTVGELQLKARLEEVQDYGSNRPSDPQLRRSFALFISTTAVKNLPQQIVSLAHPRLGQLDVFVVPIALDATGLRLQAVFNFS